MKKLNLLRLIALFLALLSFASCTTAPQTETTASQSPASWNNKNGLAAYLH
jgi:uncharacterized lipoprotein YajG